MKILHVNDQLIFGGIPAAKLSVVRALKDMGIESVFYFRSVADERAVKPFRAEFPVFVGPRPLLRSVIADYDFDLVHVTIWTMYYALPAIESCGFDGPVVLSSHQGTPTDPIHPRVDHLLSVSDAGRLCIDDPLKRPCEVILNGVESASFAPDRVTNWPADWLRPSGERPIVLWIGRIHDWRKNFPGFVALASALQGGAFDFWALHSDDYPAAMQLCQNLGENRFFMTQGVPFDRMPDVYSIIRASGGCLLMNSYTESCPNAIIQAMSSGCPVVASRVGGIPELVDDNKTGLLFDANAPIENVAARVNSLSDKSLWQGLASRARAHVLAELDIAVVAGKYRDFYQQIASESRYRHPLIWRQKAVRVYLQAVKFFPFLALRDRWV